MAPHVRARATSSSDHANSLRSPSGELRGFAKVTRDMTARQLGREHEAMLAAMFERTPFGAAMIDPTGALKNPPAQMGHADA